ncbi:hypothetical protein HK096_003667, partial [Nowakowskiella sp. JEL0078]
MASNTHPNNDNLLLNKYKHELSQLVPIFQDWSKQDLLTTLDEANGDLDLAISRISEGWAQQWGDVTKQKRKPEKQKLKTEVIPSSKESSFTSVDSRPPKHERDFVAYGGRGRGGFAGRGGRGGRGRGRGGPANGHVRPPRQQNQISDEATAEDSSISDDKDVWSAEPVSNTVVDETSIEKDPSPAQPKIIPQKVDVPTPLPQSVQINKSTPLNAKTSWAQLVKGPEPVTPPVVPKVVPQPEITRQQQSQPVRITQNTSITSPVTQTPARNPSPQRSTSPEKSATAQRTPSPTRTHTAQKSQQTQPSEPPIEPISKKSPSRSPSPAKQQPPRSPVYVAPSVPVTTAPAFTSEEKSVLPSAAPPGLKQTKPQVHRTLKQDAAVVMPANASLSSIGVQFGSLNIRGVAAEDDESTAESVPSAIIASISNTASIQ